MATLKTSSLPWWHPGGLLRRSGSGSNLRSIFLSFRLVLGLALCLCQTPVAWAADGDVDGIDDLVDNCPTISNADQMDNNNDGAGDVCDPCLTSGYCAFGGQLQVNTGTSGAQGYWTALTASPQEPGRLMTVWTDDYTATPISARSVSDIGSPLAMDLQAQAQTEYSYGGALAPTDTGFLVVWDAADLDTDGGIQGLLLDIDGNPVGSSFLVNSYTTGFQDHPSITRTTDGGFMVVWSGNGSPGDDTDAGAIVGRRLDSAGTPVAGDFQINQVTTEFQSYPSVAPQTGGGFAVAWHSHYSSGDADGYSIRARVFDNADQPVNPDFQLNTTTTGDQSYASIQPTSDGFLVVWRDDVNQVVGRRLDGTGQPLGNEIQVASLLTGRSEEPGIARNAQGLFQVVWAQSASRGDDSDLSSIQSRLLDASGSPVAGQFQINTVTGNQQNKSKVASIGNDFHVVFVSGSSDGDDSDTTSIQLRSSGLDSDTDTVPNTLDNCLDVANTAQADSDSDGLGDACDPCVGPDNSCVIFIDGFESGDTGNWS